MPKPVLVRLGAALVLSGLLAACASAPSPKLRGPDTGQGEPPPADATAFGLYLAGETALDDGSATTAATFLRQASERAPENPELRSRAFAAALLAGEVDRAAALAPTQPSDGAAFALGQLARAVTALARGQDRQAYDLLSPSVMGEHWAAASLVRPWAAAGAGDVASSLAPTDASQERAVEAFGQLNHAALLERAKRYDAAEAALAGQSSRGGVFALAYGGYLERRGRRMEALAVYDKVLSKDPTDPAFNQARSRAAASRPAPAQPTVRQGAAQALIGPAALLLAQKQPEAGLAYLRLALALDPDLSEGWVLVGDALEAQHDAAAARAAYGHVQPNSPEYATAQGRIALDLQQDGQKDQALQVARTLAAARPDDPHTLLVLADLYRDDERYADAVATLDRLVAQVKPQTAADWRLYYLRGAALERQGQWTRAEADLQKALDLKPADPEIMNYLGFAWADRGERLPEAVKLLERANLLEPDSGAYVDSLGWAHYRLGRYAQAVRELERAASLEPADPDINTHLGDAYWRTGRRLEAEYQWRRVLTLEPDARTRLAIQDRLAHGLPAQPAAAGLQP
jgi:tetratricopeptide (TPR) repeat protein